MKGPQIEIRHDGEPGDTGFEPPRMDAIRADAPAGSLGDAYVIRWADQMLELLEWTRTRLPADERARWDQIPTAIAENMVKAAGDNLMRARFTPIIMDRPDANVFEAWKNACPFPCTDDFAWILIRAEFLRMFAEARHLALTAYQEVRSRLAPSSKTIH